MDLQTIILYGKSGAGKGTQARLLKEYLEKNDPEHPVLYIETGARFRVFMEEGNHTADMVKATLKVGGLLPEFLPIWIWTDFFIKNYTGNEHIILDGLARRPHEVGILHTALQYYGRSPITVLHIDVSDDWAFDRLKGRGRSDDDDAEIRKRLAWYGESVRPSIDEWTKLPNTNVYAIGGERSIEDVHIEIMRTLNLA